MFKFNCSLGNRCFWRCMLEHKKVNFMNESFNYMRCLVMFKPRPNDPNMPTQHIGTLLGATCCVRLATVFRRVATCWVLLAQTWKWSKLSQQYPKCRNTSQHGDATCCAQQCCDMLRWHVASVWPGLYNRSLFAILTIETCSPMIGQFFYSMIVASTDENWLWSSKSFGKARNSLSSLRI